MISASQRRREDDWLLGSGAPPLGVTAVTTKAGTGDALIDEFLASSVTWLDYIRTWLTTFGLPMGNAKAIARDVLRNTLSGSSTKQAMRKALTANGIASADAVRATHSIAGIADDVLPEVGRRVSGAQVESVLDTVTGQIRNNAYLESAKDAGVTRWQWKTVRDDAVCPECDALDGDVFDIDKDAFEKAHIGCRCFPAAYYTG